MGTIDHPPDLTDRGSVVLLDCEGLAKISTQHKVILLVVPSDDPRKNESLVLRALRSADVVFWSPSKMSLMTIARCLEPDTSGYDATSVEVDLSDLARARSTVAEPVWFALVGEWTPPLAPHVITRKRATPQSLFSTIGSTISQDGAASVAIVLTRPGAWKRLCEQVATGGGDDPPMVGGAPRRYGTRLELRSLAEDGAHKVAIQAYGDSDNYRDASSAIHEAGNTTHCQVVTLALVEHTGGVTAARSVYSRVAQGIRSIKDYQRRVHWFWDSGSQPWLGAAPGER